MKSIVYAVNNHCVVLARAAGHKDGRHGQVIRTDPLLILTAELPEEAGDQPGAFWEGGQMVKKEPELR